MNPFSAFIAPCPFSFLSNLFKIDEVVLVANLGKTSLAKKPVRSVNAFFD